MTNLELVAFCRQALTLVTKYMWGDYGRVISSATIAGKAAQYPSHYTKARVNLLKQYIGRGYGVDCTGLVKWFLWTGGDISKVPKYSSATDNAASGWYANAKVRGKIAEMPERAGLILSFPGHCGVYAGGGKVIEATIGAFGDGVVETDIGDRKWVYWCECPYIDYVDDTEPADDFPVVPEYAFTNRGERSDTFSDLALEDRIGSLDPGEKCDCFGQIDGRALVLYHTAESRKVGFLPAGNGEISR